MKKEIKNFHEEMTLWRHDLHQNPQTCYEEEYISAFVQKKLDDFGVAYEAGWATTGLVAWVDGKEASSGKAIGLRADMDALNVFEETGLDYASKTEGKMHACGHDGHTTMLLGAVKYLAQTKNFSGRVYFIFQPAEEGGAGADRMIKEGLFEKHPMQKIFALHNAPGLDVGKIHLVVGPALAASDSFSITVQGKGGHAAYPQETVDPIVVGSQIITALQSIVGRSVAPIDSGVVSVTQFNSGDAFNVIPSTAVLKGTARSLSPEVRDLQERKITEIATSVAHAFGAKAEVAYERLYPVLFNPESEKDFTLEVAAKIVGEKNVFCDSKSSLGGEDFAFFLEKIPGSYIWLGNGEEGGHGGTYKLHHPKYQFNDAILPLGASYFAELVETLLKV